MKVVAHGVHGGPEVLEPDVWPDPAPGPLDVVVQVTACGTNRLDALQRAGHFTLPGFELPHVPGMDIAGEVVAVGRDVAATGSSVAVGDRVVVDPSMSGAADASTYGGRGDLHGDLGVLGANLPGGYAELCLVPASHVHPVPEDVPLDEAASVPTAYATAWHALVEVGQLKPGEILLVHAAAGGVGSALVQLGVLRGVTVLATVRGERKAEWARKLGASAVCDSRETDVGEWARDQTAGRGVDAVIDVVGPALWDQSLRALRPRGRLVFLGNTTGDEVHFSLSQAYSQGIALLGSDAYRPEEFAAMAKLVLGRGIASIVSERHPVDDAAEAHRRLEAGDVLGKQLLVH